MGGTSARADVVEDLLSQSLQHSRLLGKHVQHECKGGCSLRNSNVVNKTPSSIVGQAKRTVSLPAIMILSISSRIIFGSWKV